MSLILCARPVASCPLLIEILLDGVAVYCDPETLYSLANSCRGVYRLLEEPSKHWLWDNSLERVGLPKCPQGMHPLTFARYIFDQTCDICGQYKRDIRSLNFLHITRSKFCTKCTEVKGPSSHRGLSSRPDHIFVELGRDDPLHEVVPWMRARLYHGYPKARLVPLGLLNQLREKYAFISDEREKEVWIQTRKEWMKARLEIMVPLEEWFLARQKTKNNIKGNVKDQRLRRIIQILLNEGWERELREMELSRFYLLRHCPGVLTRNKLTIRGWKRIKPRVYKTMEKFRDSLKEAGES